MERRDAGAGTVRSSPRFGHASPAVPVLEHSDIVRGYARGSYGGPRHYSTARRGGFRPDTRGVLYGPAPASGSAARPSGQGNRMESGRPTAPQVDAGPRPLDPPSRCFRMCAGTRTNVPSRAPGRHRPKNVPGMSAIGMGRIRRPDGETHPRTGPGAGVRCLPNRDHAAAGGARGVWNPEPVNPAAQIGGGHRTAHHVGGRGGRLHANGARAARVLTRAQNGASQLSGGNRTPDGSAEWGLAHAARRLP